MHSLHTGRPVRYAYHDDFKAKVLQLFGHAADVRARVEQARQRGVLIIADDQGDTALLVQRARIRFRFLRGG